VRETNSFKKTIIYGNSINDSILEAFHLSLMTVNLPEETVTRENA